MQHASHRGHPHSPHRVLYTRYIYLICHSLLLFYWLL